MHHTPHLPPPNPTPPPKAAHQNNSSLLSSSHRSILPPIPAHNNSSLQFPTQQWRQQTTINPLLLNFRASSPSPSGNATTTVVPSPVVCHQSQSMRRFFGLPFSPPRAHSNHSPSPPHLGDPRHPEGDILELSRPPEWSTTNQ